MGICIKNPSQNIHPIGNQPPPPRSSSFTLPRPSSYLSRHNQIPNHIQGINNSQLPVPAPQEADPGQPKPQEGLVEESSLESSSSSSQEDPEQQRAKMEMLRQVSSSGLRQSTSDQMCGICYEKFHIFNKWPLQICNNQHVICDQCCRDFQKLFHQEPFPCPFCRLLVFQHQIQPSANLFRNLKKQMKTTQVDEEEVQFYYFAFEHELYEIAEAYKDNRKRDLKKLEHLNFKNKQIGEFPYFKYFKNVAYLQLQHNQVSDCLFLSPIKNSLKILNISYNKITCLDWVSEFNHLAILACEHNLITSIQLSQVLLLLKELYLLGNKIDHTETIQNFKKSAFENMQILSIQSNLNQLEAYFQQQLNYQQGPSRLLPRISTLIIPDQGMQSVRVIPNGKMQPEGGRFEKGQLSSHLQDEFFYGNLFQFVPDAKNPHSHQYSFADSKLKKLSSNFTSINSKVWIPHAGKQTLKLRLCQKNSNIMVGICARGIRYDASVYSKQFVGITLWGNIYNKSDSVQINCDLRISDGSVIAMILDFDKGEISWFIDKRKIYKLKGQKAFLRSRQLYFLYGARDSNVEVQFGV